MSVRSGSKSPSQAVAKDAAKLARPSFPSMAALSHTTEAVKERELPDLSTIQVEDIAMFGFATNAQKKAQKAQKEESYCISREHMRTLYNSIELKHSVTWMDHGDTQLSTTNGIPEYINNIVNNWVQLANSSTTYFTKGGKTLAIPKSASYESDYLEELREFGSNAGYDVWDVAKKKMNKPPVLMVIDMQNDFMDKYYVGETEKNGAFGVKESRDIIDNVANLIKRWDPRGEVIASLDYHASNHASFMNYDPNGPFPAHCVVDTPGIEFQSTVQSALVARRNKLDGKQVPHPRVVFKGFMEGQDSFGAFPYESMYNRTWQYRKSNPKRGDEFTYADQVQNTAKYTGSYEMLWSQIDGCQQVLQPDSHWFIDNWPLEFKDNQGFQNYFDQNGSPKDEPLMTTIQDESSSSIGKARLRKLQNDTQEGGLFGRDVVFCGLAFDFCVLDSAVNCRLDKDRHNDNDSNVYIMVDATRPAWLPQVDATGLVELPAFQAYAPHRNESETSYQDLRGYLNSPLWIYAVCKKYRIKFLTEEKANALGYFGSDGELTSYASFAIKKN